MAESDQEIRTRGERDAAIKESTLEFNKLARNINRIVKEFNFSAANPNEVNKLLHHSEFVNCRWILLLLLKMSRFVNVLIRTAVKFRRNLAISFVKLCHRKHWLNLIQLKGLCLINLIVLG